MQQVEGVAEYLKPSLDGITDVQWVLDQYAGEISYTMLRLDAYWTGLNNQDMPTIPWSLWSEIMVKAWENTGGLVQSW